MEPIYIILGVVALLVIGTIIVYNNLIAERQKVQESFSGIDVQLKKRQDLVPNLINTVKAYASHEKETLDAVISARNSAVSANSPGKMSEAEGILGQSLGRLFALAEAYPDLKANTNFLQLQNELANIEDNIAASRRFYNASVQDYNTSVQQFPGSLVAGTFNFSLSEFFDVGETTRAEMQTPPNVQF